MEKPHKIYIELEYNPEYPGIVSYEIDGSSGTERFHTVVNHILPDKITDSIIRADEEYEILLQNAAAVLKRIM